MDRSTYQPHWIELAGLDNVRDIGGITTADGRTLASGRVLRSDNLCSLTPKSCQVLLDNYRLSDVCDLRTNREVALAGRGPLAEVAQVRFHSLSLYPPDDPDDTVPAWQNDLGPEQANRCSHAELMGRHYFGYLKWRPDSIMTALRIAANAPGAVIVNCAAGKDRTGTVIGLLLGALGVPFEVIVADYATSGQRIRRILARMGRAASAGAAQDAATSELNEEDLAAVSDQAIANQATPPEAMALLLNLIDSTFGGVPGYLASQGWSKDDQRALEGRLLE